MPMTPQPVYQAGYPMWNPAVAAPPPPPPASPAPKKDVSPYEEKFKTLMAAIANAGGELPQEVQDTAKALAEPEVTPVANTLEEAFEIV